MSDGAIVRYMAQFPGTVTVYSAPCPPYQQKPPATLTPQQMQMQPQIFTEAGLRALIEQFKKTHQVREEGRRTRDEWRALMAPWIDATAAKREEQER